MDDRDPESLASHTIVEGRSLWSGDLKSCSHTQPMWGRSRDERWMALDEPRKASDVVLEIDVSCANEDVGLRVLDPVRDATWFRTRTIVILRTILSLAGETQFCESCLWLRNCNKAGCDLESCLSNFATPPTRGCGLHLAGSVVSCLAVGWAV